MVYKLATIFGYHINVHWPSSLYCAIFFTAYQSTRRQATFTAATCCNLFTHAGWQTVKYRCFGLVIEHACVSIDFLFQRDFGWPWLPGASVSLPYNCRWIYGVLYINPVIDWLIDRRLGITNAIHSSRNSELVSYTNIKIFRSIIRKSMPFVNSHEIVRRVEMSLNISADHTLARCLHAAMISPPSLKFFTPSA